MSIVATSTRLARKEILKFAATSKLVQAAMHRLHQTAARALSMPASFSAFFDEDGCLKIYAWHGFDASAYSESAFLVVDEILTDDINVIDDASQHPILSQDVWVTNGGVRFFANVPIRTASKTLIGMFCVLDSEPRTLSKDQYRLLNDFAAMVSETILLRLDASLHRQAAQRARQEKGRFESRFERVVSSLPLPFLSVDENGAILSWNRACVDTYGHSPKEAIGQPLSSLLATEENASKIDQLIKSVYNRRRIAGLELNLRTRSGELRHMHCRLFPFFNEAMDVEACVFVNMEMAGIEPHQEATETYSHNAVREMQQLKSTLLLNMSHELRTPLTSIIGFADILSQQIDDTNREFVHLIHESATRLMETLTAILDLSQLEGRSLELQMEPLDLVSCTASLVAPYEQLALEKDLAFHLERDARKPIYVCIDSIAYQRALGHVLDNAIKFTRKGSVTVAIESDATHGVLRIVDTGIGIRKEFLLHLFDDFVQESTGIARSYQGSGLGLAITKRLVELMGGAIEVESKKGQGSTFTIRFPLHDGIIETKPAG